ncbi:MAG: hypothetical protein HQ517_12080, partial [SAR324 cluster bacterium]|nr:hypothetical protein [SAR324 cluster bacterium]
FKAGLRGGIKDMFLYMEGLTYAFFLQKALTDADKAGDLSREWVKKALDNMTWDFMGMFDGQVFSYESHTIPMMRLYRAEVKMVTVDGKDLPTGTLVPIGGWLNSHEMDW